ncbi:uncharacterized protein LOC134781250 [Penaeus indicus]|uniref:uncharacterized protein LOC134781250 n=1 Tax=Penaeus indicus TaxID=29960 RepID=UPI00300C8901
MTQHPCHGRPCPAHTDVIGRSLSPSTPSLPSCNPPIPTPPFLRLPLSNPVTLSYFIYPSTLAPCHPPTSAIPLPPIFPSSYPPIPPSHYPPTSHLSAYLVPQAKTSATIMRAFVCMFEILLWNLPGQNHSLQQPKSAVTPPRGRRRPPPAI